MRLTPGFKLGSHEIIELIGAGGMGEIYRAHDTTLGRDVAVKVLPESFAKDADRLARFEKEARAVAALSHPNILAIYDFGNEDGHVFAVTELLEGETLRERLEGGALGTRKAIEYSAQIARGLAAAHEKGITHRDLKPENLFITTDGRVKILDFGLAKTRAPLTDESGSSAPTKAAGTEPGVVLGTVGYMSPEQVRGEPADHRSDIFSFGSVLAEMLSGTRAFRRDTVAETMTAILKEEPATVPESSPALSRIVHRCLEKNPGERFQSAYDLAFALESISRESGATKVEPSRRRRLVPIAAVVAAALIGLAGYWLGSSTAPSAELPTFERLTFRRGTVYAARFVPGGRDIVYTAAWDGAVPEIYATVPGTRTSRALGLPSADVLSLSGTGEVALLTKTKVFGWEIVDSSSGTLALSTLSGGAARAVVEDALAADFSGEGELAIVRRVGAELHVELPLGNVLYRTTNVIDSPRMSPQRDVLAFGEKALGFSRNWDIVFLERDGGLRRVETSVRGDVLDLAWSADGSEVWFNTIQGGTPNIFAMSRMGDVRVVARPPIPLKVFDVAEDGRALVARTDLRYGVRGVRPGEAEEREFSWLDSTEVDGISGDGETMIFTEFGDGGGPGWSVYLRRADGSPAVRLGDGQAFDLSRDGNWVLTKRRDDTASLVLLPTGPGSEVEIVNEGLTDYLTASFAGRRDRIVFVGYQEGGMLRWYRQDLPNEPAELDAGELEMFRGYDITSRPVSYDGSLLAATHGGVIALYPLDGGEPRMLENVPDAMKVIRFSPDGSTLYVKEFVGRTAHIHRVDIESGERTLWKVIAPDDPAGFTDVYGIQISDAGDAYYYTYTRKISDLYLVEGLR